MKKSVLLLRSYYGAYLNEVVRSVGKGAERGSICGDVPGAGKDAVGPSAHCRDVTRLGVVVVHVVAQGSIPVRIHIRLLVHIL